MPFAIPPRHSSGLSPGRSVSGPRTGRRRASIPPQGFDGMSWDTMGNYGKQWDIMVFAGLTNPYPGEKRQPSEHFERNRAGLEPPPGRISHCPPPRVAKPLRRNRYEKTKGKRRNSGAIAVISGHGARPRRHPTNPTAWARPYPAVGNGRRRLVPGRPRPTCARLRLR